MNELQQRISCGGESLPIGKDTCSHGCTCKGHAKGRRNYPTLSARRLRHALPRLAIRQRRRWFPTGLFEQNPYKGPAQQPHASLDNLWQRSPTLRAYILHFGFFCGLGYGGNAALAKQPTSVPGINCLNIRLSAMRGPAGAANLSLQIQQS